MTRIFFLLTLLSTSFISAQTLNKLQFGPKQEKTGRPLDDIVAIVGNDVITRQELGGTAKNKNALLQRIIMRKLLLQEAAKYNITVNDTALNIATKNNSKKYSRNRQRAREELIIQQLQQQVVSSLVNISDREVADIVDKQLKTVDDQVNIVDVLVKVPKSSDPQVLNQAEIKTQEILKKLKVQSAPAVAASYPDVVYNELGWVKLSQIPPRFSKVLLDTPTNQFTTPIVDNDGIHLLKVLARKAKNTPRGVSATETKTAHILIKKSKTAKQTINNIYQRLQKGANFAKLATQYSQDTGSGARGGDLGWVLPGQMVPAFEKVMKRTSAGHISKPFKTQFGYHILRVEGRRQHQANNRKALEERARQAIFAKHAEEEWELWLRRLRDEAHVEIRQ